MALVPSDPDHRLLREGRQLEINIEFGRSEASSQLAVNVRQLRNRVIPVSFPQITPRLSLEPFTCEEKMRPMT